MSRTPSPTEFSPEEQRAIQRDEPEVAKNPEYMTNYEILREAGLDFHFFVDSAEGPHVELDEEVVIRRSEEAEKRLNELGGTALE